jgi:hypothetical protein
MFLKVRRHKHEEEIASLGDSGSRAGERWLLLLSLASPPGASCSLSAAMPAASLQSLHHRARDVRGTGSTGRALRSTAAVVIENAGASVAEVT